MDISIEQYHRMFFDAVEASRNERTESEQARDYFDGKHYTQEELEILRSRRQPPTTLNRVARKINHLLGLEVDRRTDPKALARRKDSEDAAEAATDALRYVEQNIALDEKFSAVHENMLIEGYGAVELTVKPGRDGLEIGAEYWKHDRLFYDPHSVKPDFSDAQYLGGVVWLDEGEAKALYPNSAEMFSVESTNQADDTDFEDRPEYKAWITRGNRKRVRLIQMYHKVNGEWWLCVFTGGGVLENKVVPFKDEDGKAFCPLFMESAYVDRDGDRYGEVRHLISPQDMINKTHSKLQHLISVRQIIADEGAFSEEHGGVDAARQELARPDGVIIKNPGMEFEISSTSDIVAGHASLLQEFKTEIDLMGPNASMQGKGPGSQSGRALIAQTEGGLREFNPVADRYDSLKERVYRGIWFLIRQYWTEEKEMRVLGERKKRTHTVLNRPVTRMEMARSRAEEAGFDPDAVEQQIANHPVMSGMANEVVGLENDVSAIDVDIIIDKSPDMATLQAEEFQNLISIAPAMANAGKPLPPEVIIEASNLRNKDEVLESLKGGDDPQAQQMAMVQAQMQQQAAMAELEKLKAEVEKLKADTAETMASAELKLVQADKTEIETVKVGAEPIPVHSPTAA